jgi:hypothetical protein
MSDFNPGPGWREVDPTETSGREVVSHFPVGAKAGRYWVREAPVPPLPTAPYTVISVTESTDPDLRGQVLTFDGAGYWSNSGHTLGPASMARRVQAFEVLSEPRATTAKAVLDRISAFELPLAVEPVLITVRDEFGVES